MGTIKMKLDEMRHAGPISGRSDTVRGTASTTPAVSGLRYPVAGVEHGVIASYGNYRDTGSLQSTERDTGIGEWPTVRRDRLQRVSERTGSAATPG